MPTHDTAERSLRPAVGLLAMTAHGTGTAGVARVNRNHWHPRLSRLVADKLAQLSEGPIAVSCPLRCPFSPGPLTNTCQFFDGNRPLRAFGFGNEPLADLMVCIFLKSALPTRQLAQSPFGRLRANRLQRCPTVGIPFALAVYLLARVDLSVAIGCQIDDAQINPKHPLHLLLVRVRYIANRQQVKVSLMVDQIALALAIMQQAALVFAQRVRHELPSFDSPY